MPRLILKPDAFDLKEVAFGFPLTSELTVFCLLPKPLRKFTLITNFDCLRLPNSKAVPKMNAVFQPALYSYVICPPLVSVSISLVPDGINASPAEGTIRMYHPLPAAVDFMEVFLLWLAKPSCPQPGLLMHLRCSPTLPLCPDLFAELNAIGLVAYWYPPSK